MQHSAGARHLLGPDTARPRRERDGTGRPLSAGVRGSGQVDAPRAALRTGGRPRDPGTPSGGWRPRAGESGAPRLAGRHRSLSPRGAPGHATGWRARVPGRVLAEDGPAGTLLAGARPTRRVKPMGAQGTLPRPAVSPEPRLQGGADSPGPLGRSLRLQASLLPRVKCSGYVVEMGEELGGRSAELATVFGYLGGSDWIGRCLADMARRPRCFGLAFLRSWPWCQRGRDRGGGGRRGRE